MEHEIEAISPKEIEPVNVGESYIDPAFGSRIWRVSDARARRLTFASPEYSTIRNLNSAGTKLLLCYQNHFATHEGWPPFRFLEDLPIGASQRPRWSRREPDILYFMDSASVCYRNVATGHFEVLRSFDEYSSIDEMGECDLSADGDHLPIVGTTSNGGKEVFLFNVNTQKRYPKLSIPDGADLDSVYLSPSNDLILSWRITGKDRYCGIELFDSDGNFIRQLTKANGHKDTAKDSDGDCLIWHNSNEPEPMTRKGGSIVKVRLSDGHQTELLNLDWATIAVNISCQDNGPALVSTYSKSDAHMSYPGAGQWKPFQNELFLLPLDGGEVRRLAHTRSVGFPTEDGKGIVYNSQPHASIRRDGKLVCFSTNWGDPAKDFSDAMLLEISS